MKFIVEIEDIYLDGEDLEHSLKREISLEIVNEIRKRISEDSMNEIKKASREHINSVLGDVVKEAMLEFVNTETILVNGEKIPLREHLKNVFKANHGWQNPSEAMRKLAAQFSKELKTQYNAIFANHIVQGLREQGMLKDEVVQMLLEKK